MAYRIRSTWIAQATDYQRRAIIASSDLHILSYMQGYCSVHDDNAYLYNGTHGIGLAIPRHCSWSTRYMLVDYYIIRDIHTIDDLYNILDNLMISDTINRR